MTGPIFVKYNYQEQKYEKLDLDTLQTDLYVVQTMVEHQDLVEGFEPNKLPLEIRAAYLEARLREGMQQ